MLLSAVFIIFTCSYFIFAAAREGFLSKRTEAGDWVAARILILEIIFFTTWAGYMILWAISGEVGCVAAEVVIIPIFICLDLLQKNIFGLIIWSTLWNFLGSVLHPPSESTPPLLLPFFGQENPQSAAGLTLYSVAGHLRQMSWVCGSARQERNHGRQKDHIILYCRLSSDGDPVQGDVATLILFFASGGWQGELES